MQKLKPPKIAPGLYLMRNGHTAEITGRLDLPYRDSAGEMKIHPIWNGRCMQCGDRLTWQVGGGYVATGQKHSFDLVGRA